MSLLRICPRHLPFEITLNTTNNEDGIITHTKPRPILMWRVIGFDILVFHIENEI